MTVTKPARGLERSWPPDNIVASDACTVPVVRPTRRPARQAVGAEAGNDRVREAIISRRLILLFVGAVLARGRRTVTTWIRAAGLSGRFQSCYATVTTAGREAVSIAVRLLNEVVAPLAIGAGRLTLAIDDTPTLRPVRPGRRGPPQPDARPSRFAAFVRAPLRRAGVARRTSGVGRDSPTAAVAALRPAGEPAGDRPEAAARVERQAGDGGRAAPIGEAVAWPFATADLGRSRRGLRGEGLPQAGDDAGDHRRQPAAQGRGAADRPQAQARRQAGPSAALRPQSDRSGQAHRSASRLVAWRFRPVRRRRGQTLQDVPSDLAAGGVIRVVLIDEPTDPAADVLTTIADRSGPSKTEIQAAVSRLLRLAA